MPEPGFLAFALSAGAAATLNPCGFALLPAYVAYLLGIAEDPSAPAPGLAAGVRAGAAMTLGVLSTFAVLGATIALASRAILRLVPWATVVVGLAVLALGLAMLLRPSVTVGVPIAHLFTRTPTLPGPRPGALVAFGAGYGVASLGCTLPIFLVVVTQALAASGIVGGTAVFLAYGTGMGAVLVVLSVAVATGKRVVVGMLRQVVPHVRTIGAVGLILAGGYLIYYQVTVGRALLGLP